MSMRHQHNWRPSGGIWTRLNKDRTGDILIEVRLRCGCGKERRRMVGWWNRSKWEHLTGLPRHYNPDCPFCHADMGSLPIPGKCSRCDSKATFVIGSAGRWRGSHGVCDRCFDDYCRWFYGKSSAEKGWIFHNADDEEQQ